MEIRQQMRPTDKRPPVTPSERESVRFTKDEMKQLAAGLAAVCPGLYVEAIKDPAKAYEMGKVMGSAIAGIVQGITDAIEGFYDGFVKEAEQKRKEQDEQETSTLADCLGCQCRTCLDKEDCPDRPCDNCYKGHPHVPIEDTKCLGYVSGK